MFKIAFPTGPFGKFVDITSINKQTSKLLEIAQTFLNMKVVVKLQKNSEAEVFKEALSSLEFTLHEQTHPPKPLRSVSSYSFIEVIGQGAFGKVYLAQKDDYLYAVKEIPLNGQDPEKIYKEIRILARLSHPSITNYVDAFKKGNYIYIVMEYVEGLTLQEYIRALNERVD